MRDGGAAPPNQSERMDDDRRPGPGSIARRAGSEPPALHTLGPLRRPRSIDGARVTHPTHVRSPVHPLAVGETGCNNALALSGVEALSCKLSRAGRTPRGSQANSRSVAPGQRSRSRPSVMQSRAIPSAPSTVAIILRGEARRSIRVAKRETAWASSLACSMRFTWSVHSGSDRR